MNSSSHRSPTLAMHDLVLDLTRRGYDLMRALWPIIYLDDKIHRPSRQLPTMLHCLANALCVHYLAAIEVEYLASRTRRCHTLETSGLVYAVMSGTRPSSRVATPSC